MLFDRLFFKLILVILLFSACKKQTQFRLLPPDSTGIDFANVITEKDTMNILDMEFVYNGGGVAAGDLNGDGLQDLYFTGNQADNQLYLNRGKLKFEEVTQAAGVGKTMPHQWSSGINILDVNLDGKLDIYVCNYINPDPEQRRNLLFINEGNDPAGVPHFKESAKNYGLDLPDHTSHAQFFDYDNDGDLDVFLGVNFIDQQYPNQFLTRTYDGSSPTRDILLENNWSDSLGHPVFHDVSLQAGIVLEGYSHSSLICDFNDDGWQDIYVANDYQSNDILYLNGSRQVGSRQVGSGLGVKDSLQPTAYSPTPYSPTAYSPTPYSPTPYFTNQIAKIFKHQAMSSMGSDVADVNNDGAPDVFVTEMQPYYNKRKKLFQGGSSYQRYIFNEQYDYEYQYTRNVLQLNRGIHPETGLPIFSDVGLYAGVQETDWSWASLFADFDNDGWRDLYVANGFPRDVTDHDFADFRKSIASTVTPKADLYDMIPEVKSPNFMFRNTSFEGSEGGGGGSVPVFEDVSKNWGFAVPSFSNGAAYADLDNDGDLDLVVNNIDDPAFVFENQLNPSKRKAADANYLRLKLEGALKNPDAFGSTAEAFFGGKRQKAFQLSARGYLSQSENVVHFGLGNVANVDSVIIVWASGAGKTVLKNVAANQSLPVKFSGEKHRQKSPATLAGAALFEPAAARRGLAFHSLENDFIDFNFQRTLPHKVSQPGPAIAVADANGDGLDDLFLTGSSRHDQTWFFRQPGGGFAQKTVRYKTEIVQKEEDVAALLFDADGDGDNDLYLVRGSGQSPPGDSLYQDVLCVNDGKGNFKIAPEALPVERSNGSCVKAADFDGDGDLDLFVGSRVLPKAYPMPDRSFLLRNDTPLEGGRGVKFTDVTEAICPELLHPGMVTDALWTDFNGDNLPDLLLACEWQSLKFFQNEAGSRLRPPTSNLLPQKGWWNSLAAADLDNDGDTDYVAGNFGENLYFRCSEKYPLRVYAKDFDGNQAVDPFISCYWKDSLGDRHEFFYHPREDVIKQMPSFRKKFNTFSEYGEATVQEIFTQEELAGATILEANWMKTSVLENLGNGKFRLQALPAEAQLAPVYGILPHDVNGDGWLDLLLVGNDYGMELQQGRADAFAGLAILNWGKWQFEPTPLAQSRFVVTGEGRGLASVVAGQNEELIIATQSADSLRVFAPKQAGERRFFPVKKDEVRAVLTLKNGARRVEEFYWGSGFGSQKGRYLALDGNVKSAALFDRQGRQTRELKFSDQLNN